MVSEDCSIQTEPSWSPGVGVNPWSELPHLLSPESSSELTLCSVDDTCEGVYSKTALLGTADVLPDLDSREQNGVIAFLTSLAR